MQPCRRKQKRFQLPLMVRFRPTYGATDYFTARATDLSFEGLGLDAPDFRFIRYEHVELLIQNPGDAGHAALSGDIVWKKQQGKRCLAGLQLRISDPAGHDKTINRIFTNVHIPDKLGIIKRYHEGGRKCLVTFRLMRDLAKDIQTVALAGDFNNWDISHLPMIRLPGGDYAITVDLASNREYRFRYFVDGRRWENDPFADRYLRDENGTKDSILIV